MRDVDKINERLDLVEIFSVSTEMRQMMYENHLRRMPDFQRFAPKFQANRATLQDIYKVYVALGKLGTLKTCLESYDGDNKVILQENFVTDKIRSKIFIGNLEQLTITILQNQKQL